MSSMMCIVCEDRLTARNSHFCGQYCRRAFAAGHFGRLPRVYSQEVLNRLPEDRCKMTAAQTDEAMAFFKGLSLTELERLRDLNESILTATHDQLENTEWTTSDNGGWTSPRTPKDPEARALLERQYANAHVDRDLLATALDRKSHNDPL